MHEHVPNLGAAMVRLCQREGLGRVHVLEVGNIKGTSQSDLHSLRLLASICELGEVQDMCLSKLRSRWQHADVLCQCLSTS